MTKSSARLETELKTRIYPVTRLKLRNIKSPPARFGLIADVCYNHISTGGGLTFCYGLIF